MQLITLILTLTCAFAIQIDPSEIRLPAAHSDTSQAWVVVTANDVNASPTCVQWVIDDPCTVQCGIELQLSATADCPPGKAQSAAIRATGTGSFSRRIRIIQWPVEGASGPHEQAVATVAVAPLVSLEIMSNALKLSVGVQELGWLVGQDAQGLPFTTLNGLTFAWTLQQPSFCTDTICHDCKWSTDGTFPSSDSDAAAVLHLRFDSMTNVSPFQRMIQGMIESESQHAVTGLAAHAESSNSSKFWLEPRTSGRVILCTSLENSSSVRTCTRFRVYQRLFTKPLGPLVLAPATSSRLQLFKRNPDGTEVQIRMPSHQFLWLVHNLRVASVGVHHGILDAHSEGSTKLLVFDMHLRDKPAALVANRDPECVEDAAHSGGSAPECTEEEVGGLIIDVDVKTPASMSLWMEPIPKLPECFYSHIGWKPEAPAILHAAQATARYSATEGPEMATPYVQGIHQHRDDHTLHQVIVTCSEFDLGSCASNGANILYATRGTNYSIHLHLLAQDRTRMFEGDNVRFNVSLGATFFDQSEMSHGLFVRTANQEDMEAGNSTTHSMRTVGFQLYWETPSRKMLQQASPQLVLVDGRLQPNVALQSSVSANPVLDLQATLLPIVHPHTRATWKPAHEMSLHTQIEIIPPIRMLWPPSRTATELPMMCKLHPLSEIRLPFLPSHPLSVDMLLEGGSGEYTGAVQPFELASPEACDVSECFRIETNTLHWQCTGRFVVSIADKLARDNGFAVLVDVWPVSTLMFYEDSYAVEAGSDILIPFTAGPDEDVNFDACLHLAQLVSFSTTTDGISSGINAIQADSSSEPIEVIALLGSHKQSLDAQTSVLLASMALHPRACGAFLVRANHPGAASLTVALGPSNASIQVSVYSPMRLAWPPVATLVDVAPGLAAALLAENTETSVIIAGGLQESAGACTSSTTEGDTALQVVRNVCLEAEDAGATACTEPFALTAFDTTLPPLTVEGVSVRVEGNPGLSGTPIVHLRVRCEQSSSVRFNLVVSSFTLPPTQSDRERSTQASCLVQCVPNDLVQWQATMLRRALIDLDMASVGSERMRIIEEAIFHPAGSVFANEPLFLTLTGSVPSISPRGHILNTTHAKSLQSALDTAGNHNLSEMFESIDAPEATTPGFLHRLTLPAQLVDFTHGAADTTELSSADLLELCGIQVLAQRSENLTKTGTVSVRTSMSELFIPLTVVPPLSIELDHDFTLATQASRTLITCTGGSGQHHVILHGINASLSVHSQGLTGTVFALTQVVPHGESAQCYVECVDATVGAPGTQATLTIERLSKLHIRAPSYMVAGEVLPIEVVGYDAFTGDIIHSNIPQQVHLHGITLHDNESSVIAFQPTEAGELAAHAMGPGTAEALIEGCYSLGDQYYCVHSNILRFEVHSRLRVFPRTLVMLPNSQMRLHVETPTHPHLQPFISLVSSLDFSSSNSSVAAIGWDGMVSARQEGGAKIAIAERSVPSHVIQEVDISVTCPDQVLIHVRRVGGTFTVVSGSTLVAIELERLAFIPATLVEHTPAVLLAHTAVRWYKGSDKSRLNRTDGLLVSTPFTEHAIVLEGNASVLAGVFQVFVDASQLLPDQHAARTSLCVSVQLDNRANCPVPTLEHCIDILVLPRARLAKPQLHASSILKVFPQSQFSVAALQHRINDYLQLSTRVALQTSDEDFASLHQVGAMQLMRIGSCPASGSSTTSILLSSSIECVHKSECDKFMLSTVDSSLTIRILCDDIAYFTLASTSQQFRLTAGHWMATSAVAMDAAGQAFDIGLRTLCKRDMLTGSIDSSCDGDAIGVELYSSDHFVAMPSFIESTDSEDLQISIYGASHGVAVIQAHNRRNQDAQSFGWEGVASIKVTSMILPAGNISMLVGSRVALSVDETVWDTDCVKLNSAIRVESCIASECWASSHPNIVGVDAKTGCVIARKPGDAKISFYHKSSGIADSTNQIASLHVRVSSLGNLILHPKVSSWDCRHDVCSRPAAEKHLFFPAHSHHVDANPVPLGIAENGAFKPALVVPCLEDPRGGVLAFGPRFFHPLSLQCKLSSKALDVPTAFLSNKDLNTVPSLAIARIITGSSGFPDAELTNFPSCALVIQSTSHSHKDGLEYTLGISTHLRQTTSQNMSFSLDLAQESIANAHAKSWIRINPSLEILPAATIPGTADGVSDRIHLTSSGNPSDAVAKLVYTAASLLIGKTPEGWVVLTAKRPLFLAFVFSDCITGDDAFFHVTAPHEIRAQLYLTNTSKTPLNLKEIISEADYGKIAEATAYLCSHHRCPDAVLAVFPALVPIACLMSPEAHVGLGCRPPSFMNTTACVKSCSMQYSCINFAFDNGGGLPSAQHGSGGAVHDIAAEEVVLVKAATVIFKAVPLAMVVGVLAVVVSWFMTARPGRPWLS